MNAAAAAAFRRNASRSLLEKALRTGYVEFGAFFAALVFLLPWARRAESLMNSARG